MMEIVGQGGSVEVAVEDGYVLVRINKNHHPIRRFLKMNPTSASDLSDLIKRAPRDAINHERWTGGET